MNNPAIEICRLLNPEPMPRAFMSFYDGFISDLSTIYLGEFVSRFRGMLGGKSLLDIGTGTGHLPFMLSETAPECRIFGIDKSKEMIDAARANADRRGLRDKVSFEVADAIKTPFPDGRFDFVVSTCSLHHWRRPELVFRECRRVMKDGGQFWVLDNHRHASTGQIKSWIRDVENESGVGSFFSAVFWYETRFCAYTRNELIMLSRAAGLDFIGIEFSRAFLIAGFSRK